MNGLLRNSARLTTALRRKTPAKRHARADQMAGSQNRGPLSQLAAIVPDESTEEAIGDWHYWVSQGYLF